jgi:hypothetical protein
VVRTTARSASSSLALLTILTLLLAAVGHQPARAQTTPTEDPAEAAAGWLVSALTDDPAVGSDFGPSAGPTIDVLFALAAAGVAAGTIEDIADWLVTQAPSYTQGDGFDADDAAYAGASAKLALGMLVVDRDPRDVAGIDLIDQLLSLEVTDPSDGIVGRFRDRSDFGDFSTPLTQSLALWHCRGHPVPTPPPRPSRPWSTRPAPTVASPRSSLPTPAPRRSTRPASSSRRCRGR